jgi:hypothetical protein
VALRAGERFALGLGAGRQRRGPEGAEEERLAFKLGVLLKPGRRLFLGLDFAQEKGEPAPLTRLGARLDLGWLSSSGELALSPSAPPRASWGAEVTIFRPLTIRLGNANGAWTGGLGVDSGRLNADFALILAEPGPIWVLSTEVVLFGEEVAH